MSMFDAAGEERNVIGDWALRGFIAFAAVMAGWAKFPHDPFWVDFFQQAGLGQWFRYFTGAVEVFGGVLVLLPRTAAAGGALLAVTMVGATVFNAMIHPGNCVVTAILAVALGLFAWTRWRAVPE